MGKPHRDLAFRVRSLRLVLAGEKMRRSFASGGPGRRSNQTGLRGQEVETRLSLSVRPNVARPNHDATYGPSRILGGEEFENLTGLQKCLTLDSHPVLRDVQGSGSTLLRLHD